MSYHGLGIDNPWDTGDTNPWYQGYTEFIGMLWENMPPVAVYKYVTETRPQREAAEQAKADKLRLEAERYAAALAAARAQMDAAGGAFIPPPLTDSQKGIIAQSRVRTLREREQAAKILAWGAFAIGGYYVYKKHGGKVKAAVRKKLGR